MNTPWLLQRTVSQVVLNMLWFLIHLKHGQLCAEDEGRAVIFSAAREVSNRPSVFLI